jgi:hypothetical protein
LHIDIQLKKFLIRILIASGLMALALRLGSLQLEGWLDGPLIQKIFALGILILAGLLTFGIFAWFTGALNIREFQRKYRTAES